MNENDRHIFEQFTENLYGSGVDYDDILKFIEKRLATNKADSLSRKMIKVINEDLSELSEVQRLLLLSFSDESENQGML